MRSETLCTILFLMVAFVASAFAVHKDSCTTLRDVMRDGLRIYLWEKYKEGNDANFTSLICDLLRVRKSANER